MKRKDLTVLAAFGLCAVSVAAGAYAATTVQEIKAQLRPDFSIVIDGEERTFKNAAGEVVYPILYEGTTYLPVRAIGELMGKTVYWYENDKKIEFKDQTTTVTDADVIIPGGQGQTDKQSDKENPAADVAISEEKAKEIALGKAELSESDVQFTQVKLDRDNGVLYYEIEFKKDKVKYSADISAADGSILSWDVDNYEAVRTDTSQNGGIGIDKAKEIALREAGLSVSDVSFAEQKADFDKGQKVYEIEFRSGRTEYSADISAADGTILSWEVDNN